MLYKICGKCGSKVEQGHKCLCNKERHKFYDRFFRDKKKSKFYNSKSWRQMSLLCKMKASGLDLYELEINKKIVKGTLSHHIEELEFNQDRALDLSNLIWISNKTHTMIHNEYDKGEDAKKSMQHKLFEIVKKYI